MVSVSPDRVWALTESLLNDGYLPTENIIVLKNSSDRIVKEGNRRIGAPEFVLGEISIPHVQIPAAIEAAIKAITPEWTKKNGSVPAQSTRQKKLMWLTAINAALAAA